MLTALLRSYSEITVSMILYKLHNWLHFSPACFQLGWSAETISLLSSDELAKDVQGAEEMMERHQELKTEIDTRDEK